MKITGMIFPLPINHFLKFLFISLLVYRGHFIRQSPRAVLGSYLTLSIAPSMQSSPLSAADQSRSLMRPGGRVLSLLSMDQLTQISIVQGAPNHSAQTVASTISSSTWEGVGNAESRPHGRTAESRSAFR